MSGIGSFIIAFCGACVLLGAIFMLVPSGALSKPVKYLLCLIYICCIMTSVLGARNFLPSYEFEQYSISASNDAIKAAARSTFEAALKNNGIEFSQIMIFTDISDNGSIVFNKVVVYSPADPEKIKAIIGNGDNYEVTVINE